MRNPRKRKRLLWAVLLAAVLAMVPRAAFAQRVSRETAQSVAETFFNKNVMRDRNAQPVHFTDITAKTPFQNFYIFSADSGFVLVAADERVTPILGYSKTNRFVTENMPENLRWWLEGYEAQIQYVTDKSISATPEIASKWDCLKAGKAKPTRGNRSVIITFHTKWDQSNKNIECNQEIALYNSECPVTTSGVRCVSGCTATAVAQVFKKWEYPVQGLDNKNLELPNPKHPECYPIYVDFASTTYNWQNMPDELTCSSSQEQIDAVGILIKHCGVAMDMDYGIGSEGGSSAPYIKDSFIRYFDYSTSAHIEYSCNYEDAVWISMLKKEIDEDRPVLYRGQSSGAHAFVFYGYDEDGNFAVNWGWGGHADGYFTIGVLNPEPGGTGGGSYDYNELNGAVFHLMPNDRSLDAPSNLTVANTENNALQVSWSAVPGALSYIVLRNNRFLVETDQTTYVDNDTYLGSYTYQVITIGSNHRASLPSGNCVYNRPFETPVSTSLLAETTNSSVILTWEAPSNTAEHFFHHKANFEASELESVGGVRNNNVCYEVFRVSDLAPYANRFVTSIKYLVNARLVGVEHTITLYSGRFFDSTPVASFRFVPDMNTLQKELPLETPIQIENDKELIVEIQVDENPYMINQNNPFYCVGGGEISLTSYEYPATKLPAGKHFIVDLYAKWANVLTYNVYRSDGHHLTCIARDLQEPTFTDTNVPTGYYSYYVTTNYYDGESEPSNIATASQGSYSVASTCAPLAGGSITGNSGSYSPGSTVTLTATANTGYAFSGWMENGAVVSNNPTYTFQILENRNLVAIFRDAQYAIGSLVTNPDGSQGVVFHINPSGTEGWMVALNDASTGCAWGEASNVLALQEVPFNDMNALGDLSGFRNTGILRGLQGAYSGYAADQVDYANGWYLPSSGQLRKLYAALPFIEEGIAAAGGTTLTEDAYWSSSEYSATDAHVPSFAMSNANKTSTCRVRAIHNFVTAGSNTVVAVSNNSSMGMASVSGNGIFTYGSTVTVTALPNAGYAFDHWSEDGVAVSFDATYQFSFNYSRYLTAHFVVAGSVGSIICNADGSKGVSFWLSPDGTEGLMVALEDVSDGCQWGPTERVYSLVSCPFNDFMALKDNSGARNTRGIRNYNGTENEYAATLVDFADGWYLPSAGELRKLYAALPMIEEPLAVAGGQTLTEDNYWSSTEYSASDALVPSFSMSNTNKGSNCRVRAIRSFATAGPNCVTAKPNNVNFGTVSVSGSGEFAVGQAVTVTAYPEAGYVFDSWTEAGMTVSYNPTYQFTFTRSRALTANFVSPGSVGSTIVNADGSMGVVFYTDPSGVSGWQVALNDDSDGCAWGNSGEDVLAMENLNPDPVYNLLGDLDGMRNSRVMRGWFMDATDFAANQVDYTHQWFLPTAGQLRKIYAALPVIETPILNAGGTLLTDDAYWSSTERNQNEAWTPSFAFGASNKGENRRVRAIRQFYTANVQNAHVFVGTNGTLWSDPSNWINPSRNLLSNNDDVIVTTQCVVDEDATVKSLTMTYGSTISVDAGKILAATESISNTYDSRINLGLGAQLVNPTEGTYFSMNKEIVGYGNSEDGGWYTIATPLKDGMALSQLTTGSYDLYVYHEPMHYWLNQKNSDNGITMLENGIGYLYASQNTRTLTFDGQAKASNAEISTAVTNSASAGRLRGFNLIGNPFTKNVAINSLKLNGTTLSAYYKVSNGNALMAYTDADNESIRPAEGFFVLCQEGYVSFNAARRGTADNGYVRLVLTENGKMLDRAYLKVTEGGGLPKLRMNEGASELYFRQEDIDFAVAERREDVMEYPLYFKALHNGSYTIAADLLNTDCDYLHLIDNLTGADVNLLTSQSTEDCGTESAMTAGRMSYTFTAKTTDYASRFRLVFSGPADGPFADGQPIAYYADGEIHLLADARGASLQVMDMLGRVVRVFTDAARNISTTGMPAGVYVLRLISGDNVKTQKVIVN